MGVPLYFDTVFVTSGKFLANLEAFNFCATLIWPNTQFGFHNDV